MDLEPASIRTDDADLDARLRSPEGFDVQRHRWWTLHSDSLEILAGGAWRVMAILTANGTPDPVELHLEVDPKASDPDWLVLRGREVLDRRAIGIGSPGPTSSPQIRLDLSVRARRVVTSTTEKQQEGKGPMHNQDTDHSRIPAEPHIAALYEQATHRRPRRATSPPRRRHASLSRRWWQLLTRPPSRAS